MTDFQSDLIGFQKDLDTYAPGLAEGIVESANEANSEPNFRQLIRNDIENVLGEFNLQFDYVDEQIGSTTKEEIKEKLDEQGVSLSSLPFGIDEDVCDEN